MNKKLFIDKPKEDDILHAYLQLLFCNNRYRSEL